MARAKTAEQTVLPNSAPERYVTHEPADGRVQIIGGHLSDADHQMLYERMVRGLARRLYEVWVTTGQLNGPKWDWANQSTRSQQAWVSVARAVMGPALQEQFGALEIARLMHG